jgi:hypothetical protein
MLLSSAFTIAGNAVSEASQASFLQTVQTRTQAITLPDGYREWKVISVAHEAGKLNDIRAILGNDSAFLAARTRTLPFPDGAILARVAWAYTPSPENDKAFGSNNHSFVAGPATNVQVLVKDSRKFASTAGWGFGQFTKGKSENEAIATQCLACHVPAKKNDFVFTHYAP